MNNDHKTTAAGVLLAAVVAANVDWNRLAAGDVAEIGKAFAAVAVAALGYYTNKPVTPVH